MTIMIAHTAEAARPPCSGTCKHFEEGPPASSQGENAICNNPPLGPPGYPPVPISCE
jgi:hypothetical protein